jgi:hypothetical protein
MKGYIKTNLKEIGYEFENFIQLALDREKVAVLVNMEINLWSSINVGNFFDQLSTYQLLKDSSPQN